MTKLYLWANPESMAKKQSRRSVSISREAYERLKAYCETNGLAMSKFVEMRIGDYLGRSVRRNGREEDSSRQIADRIFTF
ncbi:MAG: hypothetical protein V2A73_02475 [Pseudomonadota bacterium]